MSLFHAFLLGIVQGLTEFIPVSSTAHLLIAQRALHIPAGQMTFAFLVIVQLGTVVSLGIHYWRDFVRLLTAMFRRKTDTSARDARLGWYIVIATLPALIGGYFLRDAVERLFRVPLLEASIRLFAAAILLSLAERFSAKSRSLEMLTWLDTLVIGLFQVIAVFPGASRSGATISGGMLRGLNRPAAARFAFLLSAPVMLAAGSYELLGLVRTAHLQDALPALLVGFVTAAATGWLAIRWLLRFLERHSLYGFAGYCAGLGVVLLGLFWVL